MRFYILFETSWPKLSLCFSCIPKSAWFSSTATVLNSWPNGLELCLLIFVGPFSRRISSVYSRFFYVRTYLPRMRGHFFLEIPRYYKKVHVINTPPEDDAHVTLPIWPRYQNTLFVSKKPQDNRSKIYLGRGCVNEIRVKTTRALLGKSCRCVCVCVCAYVDG